MSAKKIVRFKEGIAHKVDSDHSDSDEAPDVGSLKSNRVKFHQNIEEEEIKKKATVLNVKQKLKEKRKLRHEKNVNQKKQKMARLGELEGMKLDLETLQGAKELQTEKIERKEAKQQEKIENLNVDDLLADFDFIERPKKKRKVIIEKEPDIAELYKKGGVHVVCINQTSNEGVKKAQELKASLLSKTSHRVTNKRYKQLMVKQKAANQKRKSMNILIKS